MKEAYLRPREKESIHRIEITKEPFTTIEIKGIKLKFNGTYSLEQLKNVLQEMLDSWDNDNI